METRRRNHPVPVTVASDPLTLGTGLPGARSAKPRARDPPSPVPRESSSATSRACRCTTANPPGKTSPHPRPKRERRCTNIASPNTGLAKLVPVTASYVTCRSTRCLPLLPPIWQVRTIGTGRQPGIPRVSRDPACTIHGEPVRRDKCLSRLATHKTPRPLSRFSSPPASASFTGAWRCG